MMSIKTVNALSHYTDWTIGHVHSGALGWVAMMTIGSLYSLTPRLMGQKVMYIVKAVDAHFWIATIGIVLYIAAMWIAGVMQGLMWRAQPDGTLTTPSSTPRRPLLPSPARRALTWRDAGDGLERLQDLGQGQMHEFKAAEPAYWEARMSKGHRDSKRTSS
jgi:hypothetical protein